MATSRACGMDSVDVFVSLQSLVGVCSNRRQADDSVDGDPAPKRQRVDAQPLNGSRTTPKTPLKVRITPKGHHHNAPVRIDSEEDDSDDDDVIIIGSQEADTTAKSSVEVKVEAVKTEKPDSPKTSTAQNVTKDKQSSTRTATVTSADASVTSAPASATSASVTVKSSPGDDVSGSEKDERVSELKQQLKESEDRYMSLQRNVRSLLQIIVPDLSVPALSFVNDIVVEMIKVNSRQAGGDTGVGTIRDNL